jgi:hypothetical protein
LSIVKVWYTPKQKPLDYKHDYSKPDLDNKYTHTIEKEYYGIDHGGLTEILYYKLLYKVDGKVISEQVHGVNND